ncbi:unnamed protein product [Diamesa serratosioi]
MSINIGKLEDKALQRKERLVSLKRKFDSSKSVENGEEKKTTNPLFRNYKKDDEVSTHMKQLPNMLPEIQEQIDLSKTPMEVQDIDISTLAPKKLDFDLKRANNKSFTILERRTQKAITELIRDRLIKNDDLLQAINIGAEDIMLKRNNNIEDSY